MGEALVVATHSSLVREATTLPRMGENVAFMSAQLVELKEMLKQHKTMFEEHQKLIANLWTKNDNAHNEIPNIVEIEGNSLAKIKQAEN